MKLQAKDSKNPILTLALKPAKYLLRRKTKVDELVQICNLNIPTFLASFFQSLDIMKTEEKIVHTYTFGCKVNLFDTSSIERLLEKKGGATVDDRQFKTPDTVVVNTCTVTEAADKQARQLIRKISRKHPNAKIVVTGCYAQSKPQEIKEMTGVSHVVSLNDQYKLPQMLGWNNEEAKEEYLTVYSKRTRANLKLQNGCNAYCSFCILPYIRGRSSSIELNHLLEQARFYQEQGHHEIVLTGTHVGGWGRDLNPRRRFSEAVQAIIDVVPNMNIRISSLEPTTLTPDLIKVIRNNPQIQPHFHIPLQSGSDTVLRRMNRKYKIKNFRDRINALFATKPNTSIGTDAIVGYPGETNEEFQQTYDLLVELPINYFHVFPYSPRPGTKSNTLVDDVPFEVKKERVNILRKLSQEKRAAYFSNFVQSEQKILVEKSRDDQGRLCGVTAHYIPVRFEGADRLMRREVEVRLLKSYDSANAESYMTAELL